MPAAMEVPFLLSSAMSRAHYNLVQKVEAAEPQEVDDLLYREVETLQSRLDRHNPTSSECVELLVLLLYCATATLGRITRAMLEFAIPHAVTLAEAGSTIKQKRTGYLFCGEIMRPNDELQIMLVNTLRKDLEDPAVARICLALDALIMNCPSDAIPAVTPRLIDLLGHDSPHVKRKTIAVIRRISHHNQDILRSAKEKVRLRLMDSDTSVIGAALRLLGALTIARAIKPEEALDFALEVCANGPVSKTTYCLKQQVIFAEFIGVLTRDSHPNDNPSSSMTTRVIEILHRMLTGASDREPALILEIFRALSNFSTETLSPYLSIREANTTSIIGRLIMSPKPNIQHLCLACLIALDPILWAGTTDLIPPAFDEGQVQLITGLLESPDNIIRVETLRVLHRVDAHIISIHLSHLQVTFQSSSGDERDILAERVLEAAAELDANGEAYASRLKNVTIGLEGGKRHRSNVERKTPASGASLVSEDIVEQVLLHLRTRPMGFRRAFVDTTARIPVSDAGPTLTLVIAAVICEYGALSSISQEDLLRGLAGRLNANSPAIQEALLLAMLRVTARCDSALPDVADQVRILHSVSRRHIRHRCDQYLTFSRDITSLKDIAAIAKSDMLPDFLYALENAEPVAEISQQPRPKPSTPSPRSQVTAGKLRYEAYDPPRPAPKLARRLSSTTSIHSHSTSSRSGRSDSISSANLPPSGNLDDILSRTLTAGDLALAAHESKFSASPSIPRDDSQGQSRLAFAVQSLQNEELMKVDLIALDSPFLADPHDATEQGVSSASQGAWDALKDNTTSRGWSERSPEQVKERVKTLSNHHTVAVLPDQTHKDEILVIFRLAAGPRTDPQAVLRLLPGDGKSTLWQLRCVDGGFRAELRRFLDDV